MPKRPLLIAFAVLLLDRITKWAIAQTIPLEDAINIIPGFFRLTHLENTGAAFSLFADSPSPFRTTLLIVFSLAALAVVSVPAMERPPRLPFRHSGSFFDFGWRCGQSLGPPF